MTLAPGWVQDALAPKGPSREEKSAACDHSRICRDAIMCEQWETAYSSGHALLAFLEHAKKLHTDRMARKRAAKFARRA